MSTTTTDVTALLNRLIETCRDGQEGFRSAAECVSNPDYRSFFTELSAQRQAFAEELQQLVRSLGDKEQTHGSLAGALHRGWIDLKAALTRRDEHAILAECERGEDSAVAEYRSALEHDDLPIIVLRTLQPQYEKVQAAHDRVRDLRDAT